LIDELYKKYQENWYKLPENEKKVEKKPDHADPDKDSKDLKT
jgi:hypothetical protein